LCLVLCIGPIGRIRLIGRRVTKQAPSRNRQSAFGNWQYLGGGVAGEQLRAELKGP
jgi:hypothetical protein